MSVTTVLHFDKDSGESRGLDAAHPYSTFNSSTARGREVWAAVAMGRNNEIGRAGGMPWHLPEDLRHFKELTMGHPVIMGRATWESLPKRPLPGRRNIVLTHQPGYEAPGAETAASLEAALDMCAPTEIPFIIGGGAVYAQAQPFLTKAFVTRIDAAFPDADTLFPNLHVCDWMLTSHSDRMISQSGLAYRFEVYARRSDK